MLLLKLGNEISPDRSPEFGGNLVKLCLNQTTVNKPIKWEHWWPTEICNWQAEHLSPAVGKSSLAKQVFTTITANLAI